MTATTIAPPVGSTGSSTHWLRRALAACAVVALIAISFTVGHLTATSGPGPVTTPAPVQVQAAPTGDIGQRCQVGHFRGQC